MFGQGINDEDDEQLARAIHLSLSKVHAGVEGKIEFAQLQRSAKGTGKLQHFKALLLVNKFNDEMNRSEDITLR